jgi:hypothetical protein
MRSARGIFAVLALLSVLFVPARAEVTGDCVDETMTITGHISDANRDWVPVAFVVPKKVTSLHVSLEYTPKDQGNVVDLGIFDADGHGLGNAKGFRGWSGGARSEFDISTEAATPGYLAGPIKPGTWAIVLGPYKVGFNGIDYTIEIDCGTADLGQFIPNPPRQSLNEEPGWYRGDLHVHTVYSDGKYLPEDIAALARDAGLDFFFSTEHNTSSANLIWGDHDSGDLLIIPGEEVTTREGHWNALGIPAGKWIDWRYRPADGELGRFVRQVHSYGGLAVANHPAAPPFCGGCAWGFGYGPMDGMEVWNGPWDPSDQQAVDAWTAMLDEGRFLTAVGASDAHRDPDVVGLGQTVVRAEGLSRDEIIAGIARGRAYVAGDRSLSLGLTASKGSAKAGIGGRLAAPQGAEVTITFTATGAMGDLVTLFLPEGAFMPPEPITSDDFTGTWTVTPKQARYVRIEIRGTDASTTMVALSNPIFLGKR